MYEAREISGREQVGRLFVGRPVSGQWADTHEIIGFHRTWSVFMQDEPDGYAIIGPPFQTKAAAVGYAIYRDQD